MTYLTGESETSPRQKVEHLCICKHALIEIKIDINSVEESLIQTLKKSYWCNGNIERHRFDICQIPGCTTPLIYCNTESRVTSFLRHILMSHHGLSIQRTLSGVHACVSISEKHGVAVDMSSVIKIIPQFMGLVCEPSLINVFRRLFLDLPHNSFDKYGWFHVDYGDDDFNNLINVLLNELEYSCVLCEDYYDTFPSIEIYLQHASHAH